MIYGLVCPHCKQKIEYNDEYYDRKITEVGAEIKAIMNRLQEYKKLPKNERDKCFDQRKILITKQKRLMAMLKELKLYRKSCNKLRDEFVFRAFKEIIKEKYGKAEFMKLMEEAEKDVSSYTTEELMTIGYTRRKGERINKI